MIKSFSSYSPRDKNNEQLEAFAKRRNQEHLENLKKSSSYIDKEKLKELEIKKQEKLREENLKKIAAIPDSVIQDNIKKAEENNKKFAKTLNTNSSLEEILDSIFEKK